ncbi:MAG: TetR/AcrR family transcriptional regulator [Alphaproteobacteria bacterium]|nr:TetR/AcrR family transcriptional regulator [Alphaproteobacteria bacterium]
MPPLGREAQLKAAALDLFAERNFASVTIKDIARATGVNTALIYYYFESKDDLFRAVIENAVDQAFENFRKLRERHENPAEIIDDWLNNHVQLFEPIHKLVKVSLDYSGTRDRIASIDRSIRQFYEEESRMLSNCIRQGIAEGRFRPVDAEQLALFISTYLDGVMVRSVILPDLDLETVVDYLRQQVWSILGYEYDIGNRSKAPSPSASTG